MARSLASLATYVGSISSGGLVAETAALEALEGRPCAIHLPAVAMFMEASELVFRRDGDRRIFGPEHLAA
jgi:hypothetical protein